MVSQTLLLAICGTTILSSPIAGGSFLPCFPKNYQVSILFLTRLVFDHLHFSGLRMNFSSHLLCSKDCLSFTVCTGQEWMTAASKLTLSYHPRPGSIWPCCQLSATQNRTRLANALLSTITINISSFVLQGNISMYMASLHISVIKAPSDCYGIIYNNYGAATY